MCGHGDVAARELNAGASDSRKMLHFFSTAAGLPAGKFNPFLAKLKQLMKLAVWLRFQTITPRQIMPVAGVGEPRLQPFAINASPSRTLGRITSERMQPLWLEARTHRPIEP